VQAFVTPRRNCGKNQFPTLKPSHGAITQFLIWIIFLTRNLVTRVSQNVPGAAGADAIWTMFSSLQGK
jgi:hypothetical protein